MVVDASTVIRFLTEDDPKKAQKFSQLLESKEATLELTDVAFAEIYWTLKSFYKAEKTKTLDALSSLINEPSVLCNYEILQKTIGTLRNHNISLIDAYIATWAKKYSNGKVLSYDKDFDKLESITRIEP